MAKDLFGFTVDMQKCKITWVTQVYNIPKIVTQVYNNMVTQVLYQCSSPCPPQEQQDPKDTFPNNLHTTLLYRPPILRYTVYIPC